MLIEYNNNKLLDEEKLNADLARENRIQTAADAISEALIGKNQIIALGETILKKLSELLRIQIGLFYLLDGDILRLTSSYAYQKQNNQSASFTLGEGLVGQCALEKKPILVDKVDSEYIKISSGLGTQIPGSILLVPVLLENHLLGVIEVGKLGDFSNDEIQILRKSSRNIGVAVDSALAHQKMHDILLETQAQEEELREANEEMLAQQEELRAANEEMLAQQEVLLLANKELEKSKKEIVETNNSLQKQQEELEQQKKLAEERSKQVELARKAVEKKAAELEQANKYKSEFLANMSHELRTPLNSLLILSETLSANDGGNLTGKQVEAAKIINSSGKDLLSLIEDILDLSKVEAGKLDVYMQGTLVRDIVNDLQLQFGPIAQANKLEFIVDNQLDAETLIETDKKRINQIIKNLLSNAFKFTEYGSVTLKIEKYSETVGTQSTSANGHIIFKVIDTGIGISRDKLDLIFEAFHQEDGAVNRKYNGTGLGLSISKELAEMLACKLQVESKKDEGSTFSLIAPTPTHQEESDAQPILEANTEVTCDKNTMYPELQGKSILLVDDDLKNTFAFSSVLRKHGLEVELADDGKLAIDKLNTTDSIDLIFMNTIMPVMDGLEAITNIRKDKTFSNIPIIAFSAKASSEDKEQAIKLGADDYLLEQIDAEKILQTALQWLSKSAPEKEPGEGI